MSAKVARHCSRATQAYLEYDNLFECLNMCYLVPGSSILTQFTGNPVHFGAKHTHKASISLKLHLLQAAQYVK